MGYLRDHWQPGCCAGVASCAWAARWWLRRDPLRDRHPGRARPCHPRLGAGLLAAGCCWGQPGLGLRTRRFGCHRVRCAQPATRGSVGRFTLVPYRGLRESTPPARLRPGGCGGTAPRSASSPIPCAPAGYPQTCCTAAYCLQRRHPDRDLASDLRPEERAVVAALSPRSGWGFRFGGRAVRRAAARWAPGPCCSAGRWARVAMGYFVPEVTSALPAARRADRVCCSASQALSAPVQPAGPRGRGGVLHLSRPPSVGQRVRHPAVGLVFQLTILPAAISCWSFSGRGTAGPVDCSLGPRGRNPVPAVV